MSTSWGSLSRCRDGLTVEGVKSVLWSSKRDALCQLVITGLLLRGAHASKGSVPEGCLMWSREAPMTLDPEAASQFTRKRTRLCTQDVTVVLGRRYTLPVARATVVSSSFELLE